jgi:hypothetical protein
MMPLRAQGLLSNAADIALNVHFPPVADIPADTVQGRCSSTERARRRWGGNSSSVPENQKSNLSKARNVPSGDTTARS